MTKLVSTADVTARFRVGDDARVSPRAKRCRDGCTEVALSALLTAPHGDLRARPQ